jgi:glycerol-3-phosphate dehydrogenase
VKDLITQKEHKINAKCVINCTGAFADSLRKLDNPKATNRIIPVVGSHLVMDPSIGSKKYAYVIPKTSDGRILFQIPWLNQ